MPDAFEAYIQGISHLQNSELEQAIRAFTEAITLNPDFAAAYNGRGAARILAGDPKKGVSDCDEAIRIAPEEGRFYRTRGLAHKDVGNEAKANADLTKSEQLGFSAE